MDLGLWVLLITNERNIMVRIFLIGLLAIGCASPVRHLRSITEMRQCNDASFTAKWLLRQAENAAIIKQDTISQRFVAAPEEIKLLAHEIRRIDRKFKTEIKHDSIYTELIVRW